MDRELKFFMRTGKETRPIGQPEIGDDGTDWSLMTLEEFNIIIRYGRKTRKLMKRRNPYGLADLLACESIYDKNSFLCALGDEEKDIIRSYIGVVHHFEINPLLDPETMQQTTITEDEAQAFTDDYFELMEKYKLPTYEKPYYFLPKKPSIEQFWIKKK
jgi:hypothetical protein